METRRSQERHVTRRLRRDRADAKLRQRSRGGAKLTNGIARHRRAEALIPTSLLLLSFRENTVAFNVSTQTATSTFGNPSPLIKYSYHIPSDLCRTRYLRASSSVR